MSAKSMILIVVSFITVFAFAAIFLWRQSQSERTEAKWYAGNLEYKFCGIVFEREVLKQKWGYGYVTCTLSTKEMFNTVKEDSLRKLLTEYESVRFVVESNANTFKLLMQGINEIEIGDSLCVDSSRGEVVLYRSGEIVSRQSMFLNLETDWFH